MNEKISFGTYLMNLLKLVDVAINVLILGFIRLFKALPPACGNCHFTTSEALEELRRIGSLPACRVCKALSWFFKWFQSKAKRKGYDHCARSMDGMPYDIEAS